VGIKEASGSIEQCAAILETVRPGFKVLSGDDSLSYSLYALGGHGVVSTTAVAAPGMMADLYHLHQAREVAKARARHIPLLPLFRALFMETNPSPLKYALEVLGLARGELRLPLVPVCEESRRAIREALRHCGLLPPGEE